MLNKEVSKELRELYEDHYARRFTTASLSVPAILSFMAIVQNETILFYFAIYFFIAVFIFIDSVYILLASKPSPFSQDRYIPRYPALHRYARPGLVLPVLMSIGLLIIPQSPISIQRTIQEWTTSTPTATITATATSTTTPTETVTQTATDTPFSTATATATATYTPTSTPSPSPSPTATKIPSSTPDPKQFRGFDKNCIDQKYWKLGSNQSVLPTYKQNAKSCYDLSSKGIYSQNEVLRFNASPLDFPSFGMYTTLPSHGNIDIHFKLKIDDFTTKTKSVDSVLRLWCMKG